MNLEDLPKRWAEKLKSYLTQQGSNHDSLLTSDFNSEVRLRFEDGSRAFFRYAFFIKDKEQSEIAVFTEHCGYHIFPMLGTEVELVADGDQNRCFEEFLELADKVEASSDGKRWSRSELYSY